MDGTFGFSPELCLVTIVILVVLYLLSKLWQTQLEPNIRVIGKSERFILLNCSYIRPNLPALNGRCVF